MTVLKLSLMAFSAAGGLPGAVGQRLPQRPRHPPGHRHRRHRLGLPGLFQRRHRAPRPPAHLRSLPGGRAVGRADRGLSALLYRQDIARGFREGLRQALSAYGEDEGKADALDALQRTLGCCGVESYRDWLASPWALQQNASVPLSCCRARRGCSLSSAGARGLHPEGCFGKVSALVSSNMFCIATAALGLAVLQVVGIVLACLMAARVPAHITALH
eukprot:XP_024999461.1 tetraspanin-7-like [Gallus gallus]